MTATRRRSPQLPGSGRKPPRNAKAIGASDPNERIELTIMLKRRATAPSEQERANALLALGSRPPRDRQYITRESFALERGADPLDIAKVERFAHEHHLTVVHSSVPERMVKVSGTLGTLAHAFGASVKQYRMGQAIFRGRTGSLSLPPELSDIVAGVYGFDTRPAARPRIRMLGAFERRAAPRVRRARSSASSRARKSTARGNIRGRAQNPAAPDAGAPVEELGSSALKPFTVPEVASLYHFPKGLDGTGQRIALIELNTQSTNGQLGTGYSAADLRAYFSKLQLPMPSITAVGVAGGGNRPGIDLQSDGEVMLDIEVAGSIAPAAQLVVYFAPNTGKGFVDVVSAAVHDSTRAPSVVSISWGGPEDVPFTTEQQRDALEQILQDAAELGITVCCSAGDDGSSDLPLTNAQGQLARDGKPHVDFPASSAFALACGGTTLIADGSAILSEVVWNEGDPKGPDRPSGATGGGVSNVFPRPDYQRNSNVPVSPAKFAGRGLPDVSANADDATGYLCKLAGISKLVPIGGTSAVAPLWAGLVALINQKLGKGTLGFINPLLYLNPGAFHDITKGNNDIDGKLKVYTATPGWDPCTGLGTPDGSSIAKSLTA